MTGDQHPPEDPGPPDGSPERPADAGGDAADGAAGPDDQPHADDGLDLARRMARSVAGSGLAPRRPRRKRRTGDPDRPSAADDRDPQLLDHTLARLVADHGWALDLKVRGVFARWAELVGAEIASHTTPETFAEGRLVVRTDSTAWKTQLTLLAPQLVARLNQDLGPGTVSVIEVVGPHLPTWRKGPRSTRDGRGPRDTYG
ncbi:DUF721 domain-containing protein [Nocardioides marinus]|uniref:Putative nucleic acid-binding Zn ribbon protein n=2 Tax=Nocardioides TaxID=1839 RepID=A0A7Y9YJ93_9ACTN|nr:putative nucleic acid-binding Zn ribbon protein [Nocardioides marinus]